MQHRHSGRGPGSTIARIRKRGAGALDKDFLMLYDLRGGSYREPFTSGRVRDPELAATHQTPTRSEVAEMLRQLEQRLLRHLQRVGS